ncbi:unnamed protein product [Darwinula stevensoni]|uniref:NAD-dependent protein deacylase n=1 Tax=Darwinula stevensoni TaxID=69355 RepID=A0A7R8XCM1_9CRUS|nr:unnamed protein product [Darwinula stevensoni]CAG0888982.1 unnamed protein product [Darwinula stevensoni]
MRTASFTQNSLLASFQFVPRHYSASDHQIFSLQDFLDRCQKLLVLTGAGISTESGIPDYRSEGVGLYATSTRRPIQYQDFLKSPPTRQRYWARNYVGWPKFASMQPNAGHKTLAMWESNPRLQKIVTQNVDRLHSKAGSHEVIELHGTAYEVLCLKCGHALDRHTFQDILRELNPHIEHSKTNVRPDGDVEIEDEVVRNFKVPSCCICQVGIMKPNIVFFGDNVPKARVEQVKTLVSESDAVLVAGSSLYVYSGYRILLQAREHCIPIAIVNIGPTRADHFADLKVSARCGEVLPKLYLH